MIGFIRHTLAISKLYVKETRSNFHQLKIRSALLDKGLNCSKNSIIHLVDLASISFGKGCSIGDYSILDITHNPWSQDRLASLVLGDQVYIGEQCNIRASGSEIRIGSQTMIANNVVIVSANHQTAPGTPMCLQPWDKVSCGVTIGQDCWIGSHSTILPGSIIGDGSIIAAGAVVRGVIPPLSIWGGVPAKHLKNRFH
jgi:UDP-3-O-[3-hydroxymyristoyl] glucosamine N-acyltransferase